MMAPFTGQAIANINQHLGIVMDPKSQDWDVEYADPNRLDEMATLYERLESSDDKMALMSLIIGSLDDFFAAKSATTPTAETILDLLRADWELHRDTIHYWTLLDNPDMEDGFPVTPLMLELWAECEV